MDVLEKQGLDQKTDFIWNQMQNALEQMNKKKMSTEEAKATAALLKQGNNILAFQLDTAKFLNNPERSGTRESLEYVGL